MLLKAPGQKGYLFIFYMKEYCLFLLKSPHRGESNEYIQYTILIIKKENYPKLSYLQLKSNWIFFWLLKNEFETAVVNEPSVFEPLQFYCMYFACGVI